MSSFTPKKQNKDLGSLSLKPKDSGVSEEADSEPLKLVWWCLPFISALQRQRPTPISECLHPGLHSVLQAIQVSRESVLNNNKEKKKTLKLS